MSLGSEAYGVMKFVKFGLQAVKGLANKGKRSTASLTPYDVTDSIATSMQLDASVLSWYGFIANVNETTDVFKSNVNNTVNFIIAVKNAFIKKNGTNNIPTNSIKNEAKALDDTVLQLQNAVADGSLVFSLQGKTIYVTNMTSCNDAMCKSNQTLAVAPPYSHAQNMQHNVIFICAFQIILLII